MIGSGGNNINIGNGDRTNISNRFTGGNIYIGNTINIGNRGGNFINTRPKWDRGFYNPGWGLGSSWAGNWHRYSIHRHHRWYHGCWNQGYWGSNWYRPVAWVATGWGLSSLTSSWGYGTTYVNPYYVQPAAASSVVYDYSRPVVINVDVTSDSDPERGDRIPTQSAREPANTFSDFDEALSKFKSGNYRDALSSLDTSLRELPNDPLVHEVRALTLFALGRYTQAAASLNSLLSSAPGMDWTTMSTLYGDTEDYAKQLRDLQNHCRSHRTDAAAHFVLAYHHLVAGSKDAAAQALEVVVANQSNDVTAKRMLDALKPPPADTPTTFASEKTGQSTDLVGTWESKAGPTKIELTITEDSKFIWKAVAEGQPVTELQGDLQADADAIVLVNDSQGSMAGIVKSQGADEWQFLLDGAPSTSPGLSFVRVGG